MKYLKWLVVTATLAMAALLGPVCSAQTVKIAAAGSSAVFQAALDDATGLSICGANHWTLKNGGTMHDNRSGIHGFPTIQEEIANVWVTWDGAANGTGATVSCIYVAVDSGIGVRGYMANPRADVYLNLANCTSNPAGGNLSLLGGDVNLPNTICALYGVTSTPGATLNIAFSDVRPEDVQFQTARALSKIISGSNTNYGYGNWPNPYSGWDAGNTTDPIVGTTTVQSSYTSGEQSVPVWFELSNLQNDAFSGLAVQTWESWPVGGLPIMVLVSNQDNSTTGFGAGLSPSLIQPQAGPWTAGPYGASNINRFTAGYLWDGSLHRTIDVFTTGDTLKTSCSSTTAPGGTGSNDCSIIQLQREVLSGTYTTWEWTIPHSHAIQLSQEDNVPTNGATPPIPLQPLNAVSSDGSKRLRVIGTGEMVNAICGPLAKQSGVSPSIVPAQGCAQNSLNFPIPDTNGGAICTPASSTCGPVTNPNRIGYAFWSYGNLKALRGVHSGSTLNAPCTGTGATYDCAPPLGHYLTIDGVDPLFAKSSDNPDGALNPPICLSLNCPAIPFTHLIDGSYPAWTVVQAIVPGSTSKGDLSPQDTFLAGIGSSVTKYSDFIPVTSMHVFRSHRDANVEGKNARNGNGCTGGIQNYNNDVGQSAGGAIFNIQSDLDYAFDTTGTADTCLGENVADAGLTNITQ
jgi:hypothetical protein